MRINRISLIAMLAAAPLVGCGEDNPVTGGVAALAKECGIDVECEGAGILEGNASISGVASVDAFFQSVVSFQGKADAVSASINAELAAIRADFGIAADTDLAAELQAQISANVEGGLKVEAEPAKCAVDAQATLEAQAKCDASIDPGSAMVACEGSCEVEASAEVDCGASADLKCTVTAPSVECTGECKGSCEVELTAAAACEGTCKGTCDGECSAYSDSGATQCAGKCDGMCEGTCEAELAAAATCEGTCKGECTVTNPEAGCEGGIKAECEAQADAMVMCNGRCEGNFEPPSAKAECQASAKAEAKLNVECTPPRLAIEYELKAGVDAMAQARFVAAIENLKVRLPALLAAVGKAEVIVDAGEGLIADASGAVNGAVNAAAMATTDGNLRVVFGLGCALEALDDVESAVGGAAGRLEASVSAAASLKGALGV